MPVAAHRFIHFKRFVCSTARKDIDPAHRPATRRIASSARVWRPSSSMLRLQQTKVISAATSTAGIRSPGSPQARRCGHSYPRRLREATLELHGSPKLLAFRQRAAHCPGARTAAEMPRSWSHPAAREERLSHPERSRSLASSPTRASQRRLPLVATVLRRPLPSVEDVHSKALSSRYVARPSGAADVIVLSSEVGMATKRWIVIGVGALLSSGSCDLDQPESDSYCQDMHKECHLSYSAFSGYQRYCSSIATSCAPQQSAAPNRPLLPVDAGSPASQASPTPREESGAAPLPGGERYSAFDIPCERDSQCGPGKCMDGACYYGCQSDSQCGTGDRCAIEQATRICLPDPNPAVRCTRSAQCADGQVCLNGTCMQTCKSTEQCTNLVDRCASGVCQPDRRPLGECVLTSECSTGFVCLDGACVAACAEVGDAGVCLPGGGMLPPSAPVLRTGSERPPFGLPLASLDAGLGASSPDAAVGGEPSGAGALATDEPVATDEPSPSDEPDAGASASELE
jgi:hypothetical protein